jgi:hypothetical protein
VRENDVFPEEFPRFLGLRPELRAALLTHHGDLFAPQSWQRLQTALRAGVILEVFPYHFMRAYSLLCIKTCHRRGIHAMGGMAAQIPVKNAQHISTKARFRPSAG